MNITRNFTLEEMLSSATADKYHITNRPTAEQQRHIVELVTNLLQPLRDAYGKPITITSGFRNLLLNSKVGGSKTSAHMTGYAADCQPANGDMKGFQEAVNKFIKTANYDQVIFEQYDKKTGLCKWIHIGYKNSQGKQRKQILYM